MIQFPTRIPRRTDPVTIEYFLGMDITNTDDVRRSPLMMNCVLDDEGTPEMRTGYDEMFDLGAGPILGIHEWNDTTVIIHHGVNLYTWDPTDELTAPVQVYTAMEGTSISRSFTLGGKLGIKDSSKFVLYDGSTVVTAQSVAYKPTFLISTPPTGGGTRNEDLNLLIPTWYQQFNTEAGVLTYQLAAAPLDSLDSLELNGTPLASPADYSVNLTTGVITLVADPGTGTNNLIAEVTKASAIDSDLILNCTIIGVFGGQSDSRAFFSGNPDYPHIDWWTGIPDTGIYDPTYWPDTNTDKVGGDNDPVVGYAVQYDRMVVLKERNIYLRNWEITTDGFGRTVTRFPSVLLSSAEEGAVRTDSVVLIKNAPYYLSDLGMRELVGSAVRDERNVEDISTLVNIPISGRGAAVDWDDKYLIALGADTVWVADYERQVKDEDTGETKPAWYEWDNMPVNVWYAGDTHLYFGSSNDGTVYKIKNKDDIFPYNDAGAGIDAEWDMIFTTFEKDYLTKLVQNIIIQQKKGSRGEINLSYATEDFESGIIHTERVVLFDFADIDFSDFTFDTSRLPKAFHVWLDDVRDIQTFRILLTSSGEPNEFMGFSSVSITYQYLTEVR